MSASVYLASTDASIHWSAVRGTGSMAEGVAQAARPRAGREGFGVGVSREHWRFPLSLGRLCEAQRDRQWVLLVQPLLLLCEHVARESPACGERALAGRARGAPMRRGVSALVSLASTGASLSWLVEYTRHGATGSGGFWCCRCFCCMHVRRRERLRVGSTGQRRAQGVRS